MKSKRRAYAFLLLGLGLLLAGPTAGCRQAEYVHYSNDQYGYALDYPSNWVLDSSDVARVTISTPGLSPFLAATVTVDDSPRPLPSEASDVQPATWENTGFDFDILSSGPYDGYWDWLVEYTFHLSCGTLRTQEYIKNTNCFGFVVGLTCESHPPPAEMEDILDSFALARSTSLHQADYRMSEVDRTSELWSEQDIEDLVIFVRAYRDPTIPLAPVPKYELRCFDGLEGWEKVSQAKTMVSHAWFDVVDGQSRKLRSHGISYYEDEAPYRGFTLADQGILYATGFLDFTYAHEALTQWAYEVWPEAEE